MSTVEEMPTLASKDSFAKILQSLGSEIDAVWLDGVRAIGVDDSLVFVFVSSPFLRQWFSKPKYQERLLRACQTIYPVVSLRVEVWKSSCPRASDISVSSEKKLPVPVIPIKQAQEREEVLVLGPEKEDISAEQEETNGVEVESESLSTPKKLMIFDIVRAVSEVSKVSVDELLSDRRPRRIVIPRFLAMYLAKDLCQRSLPKIGRRMGGKDHTTVLHGIKKIMSLLQKESVLPETERPCTKWALAVCAKVGRYDWQPPHS